MDGRGRAKQEAKAEKTSGTSYLQDVGKEREQERKLFRGLREHRELDQPSLFSEIFVSSVAS